MRGQHGIKEKEAVIVSAVLPVFFAWPGTGRHGDDPVSTVSPAHTSPSLPPSESEPPLYLGVWVGGNQRGVAWMMKPNGACP